MRTCALAIAAFVGCSAAEEDVYARFIQLQALESSSSRTRLGASAAARHQLDPRDSQDGLEEELEEDDMGEGPAVRSSQRYSQQDREAGRPWWF